MCGISILINTNNDAVTKSQIKAMNDKIVHRGPDDEDYYFGDHFAFGHRRLSILDLSAAGRQPMRYKDYWITYNGEVYNYVELKEELKNLGYIFHTGTDTEVMLAAYDKWGTDAFAKFNGMWAFALYDIAKNTLIFCRDHFGIKPFYFTKTQHLFMAGSEIKQFTALPEFRPVLNKNAVVNFLARGWLNYSDESFFEGVKELRPGHFLHYDLSTHEVAIKQWYDLDKSVKPVKDSFEEATGRVRELFCDSVKIRMRSDVCVGSCLSGGIDSSSIVSTISAKELANKDFATITSCYPDKKYDEQEFSDIMTAQTGFPALKVYPDLNHLWDEGHLDKMIYHQDQPFSGASHYSEFKVFEKAREQQMIVMLDGQGADEYLCGYADFFVTRIKELIFSGKFMAAYRNLRDNARHNAHSVGKEFKNFIHNAYFFSFQKIIKKLLSRPEYPWLNEDWKAITKQQLVAFNYITIRGQSITEILYSSIPYQLHSEDRNSMLFSIESRLPFLDHRLVEYVIGLPSEYKIREGYSKYILRQAVDELPEKIKYRTDKMGFVAPDAIWVMENKERVRKELEEAIAGTGVFSEQLLLRFDSFIKGELGYEPIYFRAMAFNRFCKIFKMQLN